MGRADKFLCVSIEKFKIDYYAGGLYFSVPFGWLLLVESICFISEKIVYE
jgi:hypothetical protein